MFQTFVLDFRKTSTRLSSLLHYHVLIMWPVLHIFITSLELLTPARSTLLVHTLTKNKPPLITSPEEPLPQRTMTGNPLKCDRLTTSLSPRISQVGLGVGRTSFLEPIHILRYRNPQIHAHAAPDTPDDQIDALPLAPPLKPILLPVREFSSADDFGDEDSTKELGARREDGELPVLSLARIPGIEELFIGVSLEEETETLMDEHCMKDRRNGTSTGAESHYEDALEQQVGGDGVSIGHEDLQQETDSSDSRHGREAMSQDPSIRHEEPQRPTSSHGFPLRSDSAHDPATTEPKQSADAEQSPEKRITSFTSTSDASTRRSSIWDDNHKQDADADDDSFVTEVSSDDHEDTDKKEPVTTKDEAKTSPEPILSDSTESQEINLCRQSVTIHRSPSTRRRRRSSHPQILQLQAENAHLLDVNSKQNVEENQPRSQNTHLQNLNTGLHAQLLTLTNQNTLLTTQTTNLTLANTSLASELAQTNASLERSTCDVKDLNDLLNRNTRRMDEMASRICFLGNWVDGLDREREILLDDRMSREQEKIEWEEKKIDLEELVREERRGLLEELDGAFGRLQGVVEKELEIFGGERGVGNGKRLIDEVEDAEEGGGKRRQGCFGGCEEDGNESVRADLYGVGNGDLEDVVEKLKMMRSIS